MTIINLTPHAVQVYEASQFRGLEQSNPTTWLADGVEGIPIAQYPSKGVARISVTTEPEGTKAAFMGIPGDVVKTQYGNATGIPDCNPEDVLIVSLPMQSMAKQCGLEQTGRMVAPYKVVRLRSNPSQVLGCMGFTF